MSFDVVFFTLLLFCGYIAFAQWRITRDTPLIYYIGYLIFSIAHYGRQYWIEGAREMQYFPPPDPRLKWDMALSYAAMACYFLFIDHIMDIRDNSPNLSKLLKAMVQFMGFGIVLNLSLQLFLKVGMVDKVHQLFQVILLPTMLIVLWNLRGLTRFYYQKLIYWGVIALVIGFLCALATRHLEGRYDLIKNAICCFPMRSYTLCLFHLKVGIAVDVICFSWALTLRQKMLLSTTKIITEKVVVMPLDTHVEDELMGNINTWLAAHFHKESLTVPELARAVFLAPDSLTKKVKAKTGLTTEQYILRYRLDRGAELLCTTNQTVGAIASAVGFKDAAHFSHAFKKYFGKSPGEFRREMTENRLNT
jgi:AraC-like DNA-binding protein